MDIALIFDALVIILLIPTIVFAVLLNNRLSSLRRNREDLARLIAAFNEATIRAESGIPRLRKASEDAGKILQERLEKARSVRDDLAFMIEKAAAEVARLNGATKSRRSRVAPKRTEERVGYVSDGEEPVDPIAAAESVAAAATAAAEAAGMPASENSRVPPLARMDIESAAAAAEHFERQSHDRVTLPPSASRVGEHNALPVMGSAAGPQRMPRASLGEALAASESSDSQRGDLGEQKAGLGGVSNEEERSEAEKDLLRALRSTR